MNARLKMKKLEALADALPPVGNNLLERYESLRPERQAEWLRTLSDHELNQLIEQEIASLPAEFQEPFQTAAEESTVEDVIDALRLSLQ